MIELVDQTNTQFDTRDIKEIMQALLVSANKVGSVEIVLCENQYMQTLNFEHRNTNSATDVLSFPMHTADPGAPLGSIAISVDYVKEVASQLGHTEQEEFTLLFIHGMLHLLGYDHESDEGTMRELEKEIIEKFHLPQSLILRNEEE